MTSHLSESRSVPWSLSSAMQKLADAEAEIRRLRCGLDHIARFSLDKRVAKYAQAVLDKRVAVPDEENER